MCRSDLDLDWDIYVCFNYGRMDHRVNQYYEKTSLNAFPAEHLKTWLEGSIGEAEGINHQRMITCVAKCRRSTELKDALIRTQHEIFALEERETCFWFE